MGDARTQNVTPYVPEHISSAVETAKGDPRRDLVPWAWFALGWFGVTLPVWREFAASGRSMGGNELHRAVPACLGAIDTAVNVLGRRLPAAVSAEVGRLTARLCEDNEDLARERQGMPLLYNRAFESGSEAATEVLHQLRGIDPADEEERPWHDFGFTLGAWMHNHLYAERPLGEELADLIDTCRAVPDKFAITLPPVVNALRSLSPPAAGTSDAAAAELAILAKRHCQPEWEPTPEALSGSSDPTTSSATDADHPFARFLRNRQPVTPSNPPADFLPCWLGAAVHALVGQVEAALLMRTKRPVWKRTATGGVLRFDGAVIREVKLHKKPSHVEKALDTFEGDGWPNCIDSPLYNDSPLFDASKALNNTIEQLKKKGLAGITFYADGTGERICWRPRD